MRAILLCLILAGCGGGGCSDDCPPDVKVPKVACAAPGAGCTA